MDSIVRVGLGIFIVFMMVFFTVDIAAMRVFDEENRDAIELSSHAAMSMSVNKGTLRVKERLTINTSIAEKVYKEKYMDNMTFDNPTAVRALQMVDSNSEPPMLAVESTITTNSFFKNFLSNDYSNKTMYTREKNIVIYEAKDTEKPRGGEE